MSTLVALTDGSLPDPPSYAPPSVTIKSVRKPAHNPAKMPIMSI